MSTKSMPYSIEAEESLLGNIMLYPDSIRESVDASLVPEDFYLEKHNNIYRLMISMFENKEKIDAVSLSSKLKDFDLFDKIGGMDYLMKLAGATISANNTKEYIRIIKKHSLARKMIKAGEEISSDAYDGKTDIDEVLQKAEDKILSITRSRTDSDFKSGETLFDTTLEEVRQVQENGTATGVRTLFSDLDNYTNGFQKGSLNILAARPSMGKTALALNFAVNAAQVSHGSVAIFSLEMPAEQIAKRILAMKSKVDLQRINTGNLREVDWSKLYEATQELRRQNFYIDDTPGITVNEMLARARKLSQDKGLFMIVVDYIQLISSNSKVESRQQEVSEISRRLKAMARELNVPVVALSQLSRAVESRQDKRPMLSDLRESGALEQDADTVMFLYRDSYYNRNEQNPMEREDVELNLAKHRNGDVGNIKLAFEKEINAFYGIKNI